MNTLSFTSKLEKEQKSLYNFALKLTENSDDAQDLLHDTLYKAMINEDKFMVGTNLKGWLFTIMKNIFINNYRRNKNSSVQSDNTENQYYINNYSYSETNQALSRLEFKDVHNAVQLLTDNLKIPFMMSFKGYKYEEIAAYLHIPLGTVKIRIHSARKKLKESLHSYGAAYGYNLS
ncbi:MAG: RNA polymerase sigma factor [Bacteroidetes bacterium]|nr:RNA polymerase sigma factor [Bacteroidota bacterium]